MKHAETEKTGYDQKNCDDVIKKLRHDQDENARDQRDDWLKVRHANGHIVCSHSMISKNTDARIESCVRLRMKLRPRVIDVSLHVSTSWRGCFGKGGAFCLIWPVWSRS